MCIHIAGYKERLVCRSRHLPDDRQGKHPVFLGQRKVRTAINILFKFYDKQRTGFFPSRQGQITIAKRLLLAQHADTIFPSIVINCRGIHMMHQGESGNFPQDVFPPLRPVTLSISCTATTSGQTLLITAAVRRKSVTSSIPLPLRML